MALSNIFRRRHLVDINRLDIHMSFSPVLGGGQGSAFLKWIPLSQDTPELRRNLIGLLYARILTIHKETRSKLFSIIDELSKSNIRDKGHTGFPFQDWYIEVKGVPSQYSHQYIWPWNLYDSPNHLNKPKTYQVTLQASLAEAQIWYINFKMAWGQERILAPSSVLLSINSYCQNIDQRGCYELALLLSQINEYYKSPEEIRIGNESLALKTAINSLSVCDF